MSIARPDSLDGRHHIGDGGYAIDVYSPNKHFGDKHVVKDFSMQVACGKIFGFLDPNGNDRTTSVHMIYGLLTPDNGSGPCPSYDTLKQSAQIKRCVGYVAQRFSYQDDFSIRENLGFVTRLYEMFNRRGVVNHALEHLRLASRTK